MEENGRKVIVDKFLGKEVMHEGNEKAYLGDIISNDGKMKKDIKARTDKLNGNINKIISTLE